MASDNLRTDLTLNNKQFVKGVNQAVSSSKKLKRNLTAVSGGSRQADIALTQIARGAADARYGMFALANNAESLLLALGNLRKDSGSVAGVFKGLGKALIGPTGVVAALVILVNYGPEILNFFKGIFGAATKAKDALDDFSESQRKAALTAEDKEIGLNVDRINEIQKGLDKIDRIEQKQIRNGKKLQSVYVERREALELEQAIIQANVNNIRQKVADEKKTNEELKTRKKRIKELQDQEDITPFALVGPAIENPFGKDNIYSLFNINPNKPTVVPVDDILVLDESDLDLFGNFEHLVSDFKEKGNEMGEALKSSISNALTGLGEVIGQVLVGDGKFGDKFLGLVGGFMQAFGAAVIAIGTSALVLEASLTSGQAWLAIGAGVALVAAGSALSSISAKGIDGIGGSSSSSRSVNTSSTSTPSSVQGFGGGMALTATVRGQDLRFVLDAANDSYSGRN